MGRLSLSIRNWMLLAGSLTCAQVIASVTLRPGYTLTACVDLIQSLLLLSVVLAMAGNITRTSHRARVFWILVTLGSAGWLLTQLLWTYFEVFMHKSVPNPFVGDVILFLHLVPMMAALALRPHRFPDRHNLRLGSLDFTLLFVWWLYLYLFVVIPWQYISVDVVLYGRNFDILYTIEHVVFLVGVHLVWRNSSGTWRVIYRQLLYASIVYAFASITCGLAIDFGTYYTGSLYDIPLAVGMAWFTYVGLMARKLSVEPESADGVQGESSVWIARSGMCAALTLPLLALVALGHPSLPPAVKDFRLTLTLIAIVVVGSLRSLRQLKLDKALNQAHMDLREDSLTDLMTGARNRRYFTSTIERDVQQAIRSYSSSDGQDVRNRDLIFYLIDADCFKEVNDRYGHEVGDQVLVETARRISSAIRNSDVLIRWGGDEFMVVSRYTNRDDAKTLAQRVLDAVGGPDFEVGANRMRRSCSVGWAVFPWFVSTPAAAPYEEVLRLADAAMYEAKQAGRNRAVGMLPERAQSDSVKISERSLSLAERLAARSVLNEGPSMGDESSSTVSSGRAFAAAQDMQGHA